MPEWLKGPDCKSGGLVLRWFKSILTHQLSTTSAEVAQLVERCVEGAGVGGSNPSLGTIFLAVQICSSARRGITRPSARYALAALAIFLSPPFKNLLSSCAMTKRPFRRSAFQLSEGRFCWRPSHSKDFASTMTLYLTSFSTGQTQSY